MSGLGYKTEQLQRLKTACAFIDTEKKLGTGFLVGERRLLTCDHVMIDAEMAACRFGDHNSKPLEFRVVARYPNVDSAVLEPLDGAALAGVTAPQVAPAGRDVDDWWGWGFPAVVGGQGVPVWGQVADWDSVGPDGRHGIQLFVENFVGSGAPLGGLSGSPVLIQNQVVGMIYRVLAGPSDGPQARFGMIYAIPIGPDHPALGGATGALTPPAPSLPEPTSAEWEQLRLFETLKRASSARSILKVLGEWEAKENVSVPTNVPHLAAEKLIAMGDCVAALQVLGASPAQPRAIQLSALAHTLRGEHDKAHGLLATLPHSAESGGISGGIYKRRYLETGQRAWLQGSFEQYDSTHQKSPDPYPAINAAATALWLGKHDISRARATEARDQLAKKPEAELTHWEWATLGEAALLSEDTESALRYYEKAVALAPSHGRDIAVMRRQLRLHMGPLKASPERFEAALQVGGVACFTGHRVDEPGRQHQRFPRERVADVASRIRKALEEAKIRFGFSSAAGGGDILFVEQLLAVGGEPTIFLPFPAKDFVETSVGAEWKDRFEALLAHPKVTLRILDAEKSLDPALEDAAYARCNASIRVAATDAGRLYDEIPVLIAVLRRSSEEEEKLGGTADAVRQWEEQLSGGLVLIDPLTE